VTDLKLTEQRKQNIRDYLRAKGFEHVTDEMIARHHRRVQRDAVWAATVFALGLISIWLVYRFLLS